MERRNISVMIPKPFLEVFVKEPRIILKPFPGLWPIDLKLLRSGILEKMLVDEEFNTKFEVMIVPK